MTLTPCDCPAPSRHLKCYRNSDGHVLTVWVESAVSEQKKLGIATTLPYRWHVSIGFDPRKSPGRASDNDVVEVLRAVALAGRSYFENPGVLNPHVRHVFVR